MFSFSPQAPIGRCLECKGPLVIEDFIYKGDHDIVAKCLNGCHTKMPWIISPTELDRRGT